MADSDQRKPTAKLPKRKLNKSKTKVPMREQRPEDRILNFDEVPYGYDAEEAVAESLRCIQCKDKPCVAGCPVGIDIPEFIRLIGEREYEAALRDGQTRQFHWGKECDRGTAQHRAFRKDLS